MECKLLKGDIIIQKNEMDFCSKGEDDKLLPIGTRWEITEVTEEGKYYRVKILDLDFAPKGSATADIDFIKEFFKRSECI